MEKNSLENDYNLFISKQIYEKTSLNNSDVEKLSDLKMRKKTRVIGVIKTIILDPINHQFEVEIFDGTGHVTLIWLGKLFIEGFSTDMIISAFGVVSNDENRLVIYNPMYDLGSVVKPISNWQYF